METVLESGIFTFPLDGNTITLGRDPSCTINITGLGVSRHHAAIKLDPPSPQISDCASSFGLRINNIPRDKYSLSTGDVIMLGIIQFRVSVQNGQLLLEPVKESDETVPRQKRSSGAGTIIRIGRESGADLELAHPLVSRLHALVTSTPEGGLSIADQNSANGTFVNGRSVKRAMLAEGDIIQIGPYRLVVERGAIVRSNDTNRIKLELFDLSVVAKHSAILDAITLTIPAGEFVAILGMSGAGKSTLVRALCGRQAISSGRVYANGLPLHQFLAAFASNIGYVGQENLLHPELTVEETFREQSMIRLPRDSSVLERKSRIDEVLDLLDLGHLRHHHINDLSGGEAKRVHLGIELIASPALIVLDEPLAGLDPGLVRKFMRLFRRISDRGHTVLLTTHTLEQIEFCDRLVFLHKGKLLFKGQPSELEASFGNGGLADIYEKVATGEPMVSMNAMGRDKVGGVSQVPSELFNIDSSKMPRFRKPQTISFVKQLFMLTARYSKIIMRDRKNLLLLALQGPLIAVCLGCVFKGDVQFLPLSFYFCITISALWIGGVNATREIAREWQLLNREYRAGLSISAYLGAKLVVMTCISMLQSVVFTLVLRMMFDHFSLTIGSFIIVTVATLSGAILGLSISALSGNVARAITLLPIIFIPQIFFSGILIPFDRMSLMGRILSFCTHSRPVFSLFKQHCLLDIPLQTIDVWPAIYLLDLGLIILMAMAVRYRLSHMDSVR